MDTLTVKTSHCYLDMVAEPIIPFKKNILYVDPDISSFHLVSALFAEYNIEVIHAKNGEDAILRFREDPSINLVITEIKVPGLDGFGILAALREMNPFITVIAQTALVHENIEQKCIEAGFNEYISKPINLKLFEELVKKYIKGYPCDDYQE